MQIIKDVVKYKMWKLPATAKTPTTQSFVLELDGTEELGPDDIHLFQDMIGMIRWTTELGRTDILHEVLLISQLKITVVGITGLGGVTSAF